MKAARFALLFIFFPLLCFSRTLTWDEAVELAKKNSADFLAAQAIYDAAVEAEKSSLTGFLPHLNAKLRGTESGGENTTTSFSYGASLNLSQNLFSGLSDYANYKLKQATREQAAVEFENVKARISQELKQVFAEAYHSQLAIKLSRSILKRREENLMSVRLQYEGGQENKGSLLLSQANVDSAKYDLVKALNDAVTTFDNLRRFLGLTGEEKLEITENVPVVEAPAQEPEFRELAKGTYSAKKSQNEFKMSQYTADVSRGALLPSLDLNADYGYSGSTYFPQTNTWSFGVTLTVPLFDGWRDYATYRSNANKSVAAGLNFKDQLETASRDLKNAYFDFIESIEKERVDNSFSKAAQVRAEIARNKYKNGLLNFENWDLIESDLILKEKNAIASERDRVIKQSVWEKMQGIGVLK